MTAGITRFTQRIKRSSPLFSIGGYFFATLYALVIIIPLYFVLVSAFKNNTQIISTPLALPTTLSFAKFIQAQAAVSLFHAAMISTIITVGAEALTLLLAF